MRCPRHLSRDSLAVYGADHGGADIHTAAHGGPTVEGKSVSMKEWQRQAVTN